MNPTEVVTLARYVRALCPQQKFDEYTPNAWGDILGSFRLDDARAAAARVAARQPFVSPAEIVAEIRVLRSERTTDFQYEPTLGDDDPEVYLGAYRQQLTATADGHRPPVVRRAITGPTMPELLAAAPPMGELPDGRRGPLGVVCPTCTAPIGRPCRTALRAKNRPHSARKRVAGGEAATAPLTIPQATAQARAALAQLTPAQRAELLKEIQ
ncbi:hypothetical protein [Streptomyces sp. NPDC058254]|uniref:zinc finger domain-containing protein n=1 Tax=Streptomyces sp. NPDC058254 TaxID=3346406 RepID=UPI0036E4B9F4